MKDYYALLGIGRKATKAEIKKNYRLLATKYHPDKSKDPSSASKFIAITEAYDTLNNKKRRAAYDLRIWELQKREKASNDSFATVVPPRESTRTRRNREQQERSVKYHQVTSKSKRTMLLILESFSILSRYIFHILGMTLITVILTSALSQFLTVLETNVATAIWVCAFSILLVWALYMIALNVFREVKKDMTIFSIYYKISLRKAMLFSLPVFVLVLLIYMTFLKTYGD